MTYTYTIYSQNAPQRNQLGDFEANFVALGTVKAESSAEAWKQARQHFPRVKWPVIERTAS